MSIQVCEGVWMTRDGEHVEVRARDTTGLETEWRWEGMRRGHMRTWRDDGTIHIERRGLCDGDLVEFLRPLPGTEAAPEPQTTTDTLAQIEGQIDQAEPWERLAMALQQQVTESLADRDRLEQQLATMTTERDNLAQRVWVKPSEEALQKQVSRQQIQINTLQDKLTDMTVDRDRLQARVRDLEIEIDAIGQQPAPADTSEQIERIWDEARERAVSEIIELITPLQVATGTHAEAVLQILPAVIRRWMDGGTDDVE
jgi:hypothetical protein